MHSARMLLPERLSCKLRSLFFVMVWSNFVYGFGTRLLCDIEFCLSSKKYLGSPWHVVHAVTRTLNLSQEYLRHHIFSLLVVAREALMQVAHALLCRWNHIGPSWGPWRYEFVGYPSLCEPICNIMYSDCMLLPERHLCNFNFLYMKILMSSWFPWILRESQKHGKNKI